MLYCNRNRLEEEDEDIRRYRGTLSTSSSADSYRTLAPASHAACLNLPAIGKKPAHRALRGRAKLGR